MARHTGPVLADTNVIIECWRARSWAALAGGYRIETVEECVIETQTGFQRRTPEQQIDEKRLRASLGGIHAVSNAQRATALLRDEMFARLDLGERTLWAHALTRNDNLLLCGPDKASLRLGVRLGFRERLIALETLLNETGHRPKIPLRLPYTAKWLDAVLNEIAISEGARR